MAIHFKCGACGHAISVNDGDAGKRGRCHGCGEVMRVPAVEVPATRGGPQLNADVVAGVAHREQVVVARSRSIEVGWIMARLPAVSPRFATQPRTASISNTKTFRNTCSIACMITSAPGVPNGMSCLPLRIAIAGEHWVRGLLPGATEAGWSASAQNGRPDIDVPIPVPGTTGQPISPSVGVAENALP